MLSFLLCYECLLVIIGFDGTCYAKESNSKIIIEKAECYYTGIKYDKSEIAIKSVGDGEVVALNRKGKLVLKGKKTGKVKVDVIVRNNKYSFVISVLPSKFSSKAPGVIVSTGSYFNNTNVFYDTVSWGKVRGASGYKIYRKEKGKLRLIKKTDSKTRRLYIKSRKSNEFEQYYVIPYCKINKQVYYGNAGYNAEVDD